MAVGWTCIWFHLGWFRFQSLPPSCLIITPTDFWINSRPRPRLRRFLINNWLLSWLKNFHCGLRRMFGVHTIISDCSTWLRMATMRTPQHCFAPQFPFLQQNPMALFSSTWAAVYLGVVWSINAIFKFCGECVTLKASWVPNVWLHRIEADHS